MRRASLLQILFVVFIGCSLITGCYAADFRAQNLTAAINTLETPPTQVSLIDIEPSSTPSPTPTTTFTATLPEPTPTITMTPTPQWVYNPPGSIYAPILLYHRVNGETSSGRYEVSEPDFHSQMLALKEMGYTAIPMSLFLQALNDGADLPEKPIVITFDGGHQSVYDKAFPIMKALGFPGVFYIVANRINGSPEFVNISQLQEMIDAGWEIGSHSYTHSDLTLDHSIAEKEIRQSKLDLEYALSTDVSTFAYPFGTIDPFTVQKVSDFGYQAGMGLGKSKLHTWNTIFYLNRIEIYGTYSLDDFKMILSEE